MIFKCFIQLSFLFPLPPERVLTFPFQLFAMKFAEVDELLAKSTSLSDGVIYATCGVVQATFADDAPDVWNKAQKVAPPLPPSLGPCLLFFPIDLLF